MTRQPIASWADLFARLNEAGLPLMHILKISKQSAYQMRNVCRIPPSHWNELVLWAEVNGEPEITYELLARLAANQLAAKGVYKHVTNIARQRAVAAK